MNDLRVVYFGNYNTLSRHFLVNLLQAPVNVTGVLLPGYGPVDISENELPVASNEVNPTLKIIKDSKIPLCHGGKSLWTTETRQFLHSCKPDIILSVCFPHFVPKRIRSIAQCDNLNFHSSLLPKYRGSAPVFWQLYYGETNTGFSIHRLSNTIDAGEVLCQQPLSWPSGATADEIDTLLAREGAQAFCKLLQDFTSNSASSQAQIEATATYYPSPGDKDYIIPTTWSVERAFAFLRGVACHPALMIRTNQGDISVEQVVAFSQSKFELPAQSGETDIEFNPGVLRIRER